MKSGVKFRRIAVAVVAALCAAPAAAQYPAKPMTMVIGYPPGSGIELVGRFVAEQLKDRLGQPLIVENKPGAIASIAAAYVARSAADGYTMLYTPNSTHAANIHLYRNIGFHPVKDFSPVTTVVQHPFFLAVHPTNPANTVAELTAYLKKRPGKTNFGSGSSTGLVGGHMYVGMAKLDTVHVPYKGMPQVYQDLMAGRLDFIYADSQLGFNFVKAGKIKGLAVTSGRRFPLAPDMPTMAESGFPGFDLNSWHALFLPAGAPRDVVLRLAQEKNAAMKTPKAAEFMKSMYVQPFPGTPESSAKLVETEMERWGKVIRAAGIEPQ